MKALKSSTALALALGLGVSMGGMQAYAAGDKTEAGATTAAGTGTATGAQAQAGADVDQDEFVTADEARTAAEQQFQEFGGGQEYMTEEQFGTAFPEAGDAQGMFAQIDEDGDGQISREEWMNWREQGFAEATQGTEGQMPAQDWETWQRSPGELGGGEAGAGETGMTTPTGQGTGTSQ